MMSLLILSLFSPHLSMPFWSMIFPFMSNSFIVDNISFPLLLLTLWILGLMSYYKLLTKVMLLFLIFVFSVHSYFYFYLFFEASLIPILLIILKDGGQPERLQAGVYLLFYTLFFSLPLLISIVNMNSLFMLAKWNECFNFFLLFAFLVKMPMFLLHYWLPKAHLEAPLFGSMILAGILLKIGGYGLIRCLELVNLNFSVLLSLNLVALLVVSFICLRQTDMKKLIAFSSVGHMSLVILSIFSYSTWGIEGSILMMLAHGLSASGMFFVAGSTFSFSKSRSLYLNKSLICLSPILTMFWFIMTCGNMGSPPFLNFFGEILMFVSLMNLSKVMILPIFGGGILVVAYSIFLYSNVNYSSLESKNFSNVKTKEYFILQSHVIPLFLFIFCFNW